MQQTSLAGSHLRFFIFITVREKVTVKGNNMKVLLTLMLALINLGCESETEIHASLREAGYERLKCRGARKSNKIVFTAKVTLGDNPILARCDELGCEFQGVSGTEILCQEYTVSHDSVTPTLYKDHEIWVFDVWLDIKE
jgi:hypothetical protein